VTLVLSSPLFWSRLLSRLPVPRRGLFLRDSRSGRLGLLFSLVGTFCRRHLVVVGMGLRRLSVCSSGSRDLVTHFIAAELWYGGNELAGQGNE
jgi:hypothetical protein